MRLLVSNQIEQVGQVWVLALSRGGTIPPVTLSQNEKNRFDEMSAYPKRQTEWLWGRACLKQLVSSVLNVNQTNFEILNRESGAPMLCSNGIERAEFVSLSHTKHFTAAALSVRAVGIDICELVDGPRMRTIASRVFIEDEAERIGAHDSDVTQSSVWAIKESALKLRQEGVFVPGTRSVVIESLHPLVLRDSTRQVSVFRMDGCVVAVATEAK
jgi:phosphopantetheinyl transferase